MATTTEKYDYAIVGGGMAGLSLAVRMAQTPALARKKIVLLDRERKTQNDRTWCFWTDKTTLFDAVICRSWQRLGFSSPYFSADLPLKKMRYHMLRGIDFYRHAYQLLEKVPNIHFLETEVTSIENTSEKAIIHTKKKGVLEAEWAFDSRISERWLLEQTAGSNLILQHFKGWVVETDAPFFDAEKAQMFDFNLPQNNEVRFVYILPFSPTKALVEFTVFSPSLLESGEYEKVLQAYFAQQLQLNEYRILEEENGILPMTDYEFPRMGGHRTVNIGMRGGACKPSTGYAFLRAQRDAEQLAKALQLPQPTFPPITSATRFSIYDAMILRLMRDQGGEVARYFAHLFKKNPTDRLLRFLDEQTTFAEELGVMASVPTPPFLGALVNVLLERNGKARSRK